MSTAMSTSAYQIDQGAAPDQMGDFDHDGLSLAFEQSHGLDPYSPDSDSDGRPDRALDEILDWAREHDLPCDERGHVQFPDARIEYDIDGRDHHLDLEVMTPHYRGAHASAKSGSGFSLYFSTQGRRGGGGRTPSVIEELL